MALAKAFMDGDIQLVAQKWVAHLNAPLTANWNDWPVTEEIVPALWGWLGRFVGLFAAANLMVLLCHLLAGLAFWFVGREMNARPEYVFVGAVAYALSHFAFWRGLGHLGLTMYWHLPLLCLVSWWVFENTPLGMSSRRGRIALFSSAVAGALNPYFAWIYLQFLGFAILKRLVRREALHAVEPGLLAAVTLAVFVLFNIDTFSHRASAGENSGVIVRNFAALEVYGLKLPELFLPLWHRWERFAEFAQRGYYTPALIKGEIGSAYLGVVGTVGLVWLVGHGLIELARGTASHIHTAWWQVIWVSLYSLIGGLNLILGSAGLILFRGTNRYSIVILTLSLMFLVGALSRYFSGKFAPIIAFVLVPLIIWDQVPKKVNNRTIAKTEAVLRADKEFGAALEYRLPKDSMVFQLPVMPFPEHPPINTMEDYEPFRPYLHTASLRYSYGTNKGRVDSAWQELVARLPPREIVDHLESAGFGAVIVNRKGYQDGGEKLIEGFREAGKIVAADSPDMIAFALQPAINPVLPLGALMSIGWSHYEPEADQRWAVANFAVVDVQNSNAQAQKSEIRFRLAGLRSQNITISVNGLAVKKIALTGGAEPSPVQFALDLLPGRTRVEITSDAKPERPGNGDMRTLSFAISDFYIK
jgi:phosphoglycerol transferase